MKKNTIIYILAVLIPVLLFGNEGAEGGHYLAITGRESDFWPRIFNFAIFAGLAYYLLADTIRGFFKSRSENIASQLKEIEAKLQAAKEARKSAEKQLEESKRKAEEILRDAEKEVALLKEKFAELGQKEIEALQKQFEEKLDTQERKMKREMIASLLDENISNDDIPLSGKAIVETVSKKVA